MPKCELNDHRADGAVDEMYAVAGLTIGRSKANTVAAIVATHFGLSVKRLLNLPYCQRRARIVVREDEAVVYYGERPSKKLLKLIAKSVGMPHLEWRSDEHEQRLDFDVAEFRRVVAAAD